MATSAGQPGQPNEDFAGAVPSAVVLLDGAGIPGTESICCHGVAWYTHRLGAALLARLSREDGQELTAILATAIGEVAASHRGSCDVTNPSSPQATVAIIRSAADQLDYLLLADCFLVLDQVCDGPVVITDEREVTVRRMCSGPLADVAKGASDYERVRDSCIQALQARRNQPGGYWIAKDDPRAAEEAVTGSCPVRDLDSAALLSNGASRIVSPYALTSWSGVLEILTASGPEEVIRRIRRAEADGSQDPSVRIPDDATVAHWPRLQHYEACSSSQDDGGFGLPRLWRSRHPMPWRAVPGAESSRPLSGGPTTTPGPALRGERGATARRPSERGRWSCRTMS